MLAEDSTVCVLCKQGKASAAGRAWQSQAKAKNPKYALSSKLYVVDCIVSVVIVVVFVDQYRMNILVLQRGRKCS